MNGSTVFDYYYGDESSQFSFYRIPRQLITGQQFKKVSTDAKLLYGLLLDRMGLSARNSWYDDAGRVYIFYTLDEIQEDLNCGHEKAVKLLSELDTDKGCGLIERMKQGQGKPTKIYVKRFTTRQVTAETIVPQEVPRLPKIGSQEVGKSEVKSSEKPKSRLPIIRSADFGKSDGNYTESNQTDFSYKNQSIHPSPSAEQPGWMDIPISELARAAQMKMDALKRKAGRRSKADILAGKEPMKRSDEQVGEDLGMSRASVQRLMRVNQLEEPLKKMVDKKELPLDTAEQISHMKPTEQKTLADAIEKEGGKVPSKTEAVKLKEESRAGTLTAQKIENSVAPTKREIDPPLKVTFQDDELRPYFPDKGTTVATVKRTMFEAMDLRKKALERQKMKMQTEKEPKKKSEPER